MAALRVSPVPPVMIAALVLLTGCGTTASSPSAPGDRSMPSLVPPDPSNSPPSSAAVPSGVPEPSPTALEEVSSVAVGTLAIVLVDGVNVREAPTRAAPVQTIEPGAPTSGQPIQIAAGDLVWVLEEEHMDSDVWYQVVQDRTFNTGWIGGGPQDDPWLRPFDPQTCPHSLADALAAGDPIKPFSMENLVCFGDEELSARVYWLPAEALNLPCPWPDAPTAWLICSESVNVTGDNTQQLVVYGTVGRDDIIRGEWVALFGHYDDPRSRDCPQTLGRDMSDRAEVAATIVSCRSAFVLDEVRPAGAP